MDDDFEGARRPGPGWRFARWLAGRVVRAYYPDVTVTGAQHVPDGIVLVAANHPNSLVDPVLISAFLPLRIRWLAKAPLFDNPTLAPLLRAAGVIPVKRRHEGGDAGSTSALLRTAADALLRGDVLGMFPEGTTHDRLRLVPLRTGVGRIAVLTASEAPPGRAVAILPVALHFPEKLRFRSEAVLAIGRPVPVDAGDDPDAVTQRVKERLEGLLVHVEDDEQERLLEDVRLLERRRLAELARATDAETLHALDREIAKAIRRFAREEPERLALFSGRLARWRERLRAHGLATDLFGDEPFPSARQAARTGLALLLLPVALFGLLHSAIPYHLADAIARRMARDTDRTTLVMYRLLAGLALLPAAWIVEAILVGSAAGAGRGLLFLLLAPPTALVARWVVDQLRNQARRLEDAFTLGLRPQVAAALRAEREALWGEVERWRRLHVEGGGRDPVA